MTRVAITGVGLVTALGIGTEETWQGMIDGRTGIGTIAAYDHRSLHTNLAAEIPSFEAKAFADRKVLRNTTRNDQLAIAGAVLAARDSGAQWGDDPFRAALFSGSNKEISNPMSLLDGALAAREEDGTASYAKLGREAKRAFHPLFFIEGLQAASLFYVSSILDIQGANTYFAGTADAGVNAIGRAFRAIKRGEADVAVAGGFDDASSWWTMSKMDGLGVLTTRNDRGAEAFRPYDVERSGSVLGEGSAFLVLEDLERARARDARVYAEVTGFGSRFDGERTLTPSPDGAGLAAAIGAALREAATAPDDVDYIALHGCATRLGDPSEVAALRRAFGAHADALCGSSVKPATGHLVAAAGALNVAVGALALRDQVVPPTLHVAHKDPACDVDVVPNEARKTTVRNAIAIGRGLEGQQAVLALRAL